MRPCLLAFALALLGVASTEADVTLLIDETPVYGSVTIEKPVIIKVAHTLGGSAFFTINGIEPNFASEAFPATGLQVSTSVALKVAAYSPNFDKVERTELVVTRVDPHRYTLQVTRVPLGVTITPLPPADGYLSNTLVTVTVPAEGNGWTFEGWEGDLDVINPTVQLIMNRNKRIAAVYSTPISTVTAGPGTIEVEPTRPIYGNPVKFTALPAEGGFFATWGNLLTGNQSPVSVANWTRVGATISAAFGELAAGEVSLTILAEGFGTASSERYRYNIGETARITADRTAWDFAGWPELDNRRNVVDVVMNSDKTVTARFVSVNERWKVALTNFLTAPALGLDGTIYTTGTNKLFAVSPQGTEMWSYTANPSTNRISAAVVGPNGNVYFTDHHANLFGLNSSGEIVFTFHSGRTYARPPMPYRPAAPTISTDGTFYVRALNGKLWSISPAGATNWIREETSRINTPVSIAVDGTIYAYDSVVDDGRSAIQTRRPSDGDQLWRSGPIFGIVEPFYASPVLDQQSRVFAGQSSFVHAISNNVVIWTAHAPEFTLVNRPAVGRDNRVYFSGNSGAVGLFRTSGNTAWKILLPGIYDYPIVSPNEILSAIDDSSLKAFWTRASARLWEATVGTSFPEESPLLANRVIYTINNNQLAAHDWAALPEDSGWPMHRADPQRTGQVSSGPVTLQATVSGPGQLQVSPDQTTYQRYSTVTIAAQAAQNSQFLGWEGYLPAHPENNPITVFLDQSKQVHAVFGEALKLSVEIQDGSLLITHNGSPYREWMLETSSDLHDWTPVTHLTGRAPLIQSASAGIHFFRLRSLN